jgi:hypothetical protein
MNRSRVIGATAKTTAAVSGLLATAQHPVLLYLASATIFLLVAVVVGAAALSRKKYRRDAAYAVLRLIADILGPPRSP